RMDEVLTGLVLLLVTRILAAVRMKLLTDKQGLSFSPAELFEIGTTATFYGLILPGTISGGLIRWYKLAKQGEPVRALAALTWDRLADAAAVAGIGVAGWLLSRPGGAHTAVGLALLAVFAGLALLYLVGFSHRTGEFLLLPIETVVRRLRGRWGHTKLQEAIAAARQYHKAEPGFPYAVAVLSIAAQVAGAGAFLLWARSIGTSVGFAELTWARSCYMLMMLLPITFAGLGTREGILILLLRPYGVSGAEAVALAFLQLGATLVMAGLGGLFELRTFWRAERSIGKA
ncbi:MAG TPA: lysylphosphatidylglycerol synthase transmembrane domain-containing protein, partial [Gemmatimonadales bacterium]|nr:lysylphosphatidylglycerol synthase transmembrane domain-containing protein [Gemmatimonadales bacterium]